MGRVYAQIPPEEKPRTGIFASNYGEAGAINLYGPAYGLPRPYSGHLAFWRWGPPPETATGPVIFVGRWTADGLAPHCGPAASPHATTTTPGRQRRAGRAGLVVPGEYLETVITK